MSSAFSDLRASPTHPPAAGSSGDGIVVVGLEHQRADPADDGVVIGEDGDHVDAALDLESVASVSDDPVVSLSNVDG
jgi:hypothetical protein